jgi:hypothetical protein
MSFMTKCKERLMARLARTKLVTKYKERTNIPLGWKVELQCPQCGHDGLPKCSEGWTVKPAEYAKNTGDTPLICTDVKCSECDHDLKERAGEKLTELFKDVPKTTIGLLGVALGVLIFSPGIVLIGILAGMFAGWWGDWVGWWIYPAMVVCLAITLTFIYITHPLIYACECGSPFLFMGRLGRSYCFRCSSCSRLLRRGR